jgi:4-hydroxy-3-polyprenylbenzoate decarboxylase
MLLVIGITGASGAIYGVRLLEVLADHKDVTTHLIVSKAAAINIKYETGREPEAVRKLADVSYDEGDIGAGLSSGSFKRDGMVIAPCSMKTLSAVANAYADNLIARAADTTLKERKRLVLLVREAPLHLGHLRNMVKATEMGAICFPPVPALYHKPRTIEDIVDYTVGRVLDLFDIKHDLFKRWAGLPEGDK